MRGTAPFEHGGLTVAPTLPHLSPAQRERLEQLADAAPLRTALFPSLKPLSAPAPGSTPEGGRTCGAPGGVAGRKEQQRRALPEFLDGRGSGGTSA